MLWIVSSDSLTADKRLGTCKHPHISILCTHADTKKTAARAQTGTDTPPATKTDVRAFLGDSLHTWPQINLQFIQHANCLPVCSHTTHTQTSRWTTYWCHFLYQHSYSLDFSSLDRCLQRCLAAQSAWTQPCQDHRNLIQNRFTGGTANWYNGTNNSIQCLGLFWILVRKTYLLHSFTHTRAHSHAHTQRKRLLSICGLPAEILNARFSQKFD